MSQAAASGLPEPSALKGIAEDQKELTATIRFFFAKLPKLDFAPSYSAPDPTSKIH